MINFETSPDRYQHWKLRVDGAIATLTMDVNEDATLFDGYKLKLNSYDLGVDIELADAVERLRFESPQVRVVVVTSLKPRIFCAGANIYMLGGSTHAHKVNFCKFTNETRCGIEDASRHSGQRYLAALNGTASGGGYELALACEEIYLVDDSNAAVSLPEVPLLGVLPGTGGLTRLVDKRKIRRDRADIFSTLAEGLKAKRAKEWGLIDGYFATSKFDEAIAARARELALGSERPQGIKLHPLQIESTAAARAYRYVSLRLRRDKRYAELTMRGPDAGLPTDPNEILKLGDAWWPLDAFRELDNALLHLRVNEPEIGLVCLRTSGELENVLAMDRVLTEQRGHWLVRETRLLLARALRRLDLTAKSFFALIEPGSCFAGSLLELALASDRMYMLNDLSRPVEIATSELNGGALPMSNGLTRLQSRFLATPEHVEVVLQGGRFDTGAADDAGLVTAAPDGLDWDDEIRLAIEERTALSPDALTGMEANLRFAGAETCDTKIFGRLTAWQNWIFQRPNTVGEHGALTNYGKPAQAKFDYRRT
ncbi:MAG: benzoyl-CoA-dihydrodiol lyase [Acidobacteria bacterium]|nr:benzoyl-CoA-dihydrodiol lyase [Acidobacteriota bacterium]